MPIPTPPAPTSTPPDSTPLDNAAPDNPAPSSTARDDGNPAARRARAGDLEDRVWAALRHHPGATAAELAAEASASRSAVGKLLAAWAADGSATSTPGPKPRDARRWSAAPAHIATPPEGTAGPDENEIAGSEIEEGAHAEASDQVARHQIEPDSGSVHPESGDDAAASPEPSAEAGSTAAPCAEPEGAPGVGAEIDGDEVGSGEVGGEGVGAKPARRRPSGRPRMRRNRSGSTRLPKGGLRGQVEDYLADTSGEHSPVQIGKVLGRSSGAIANALESLVECGGAVRTSDHPRRYSHCDHAEAVDQTRPRGDHTATGSGRTRGPDRGVCGVGTYVTVLTVLPLDSIDAISTDEIADWVRARTPAPVLFAVAAHGVTRAALSAGAEPSNWPTPTTHEADVNPDTSPDPGPHPSNGQLDSAEAADTATDAATGCDAPPSGEQTDRHGVAETRDASGGGEV